jgi:lysophospholipase L1-like esterase
MKNASSSSSPASRRDFIKSLATGTAIPALAFTSCRTVGGGPKADSAKLAKGDVILFQGDSITDAGRSRERTGPNEQSALGNGYPWFAASEMLVDRPEAGLRIYNRGISGNKVYQLAERWDQDCLQLRPNLLSILIGVNDFWHTLNGTYHGTVEIYERDYRALLERTLKAVPKVKLVICEPFVLRCGVVNEKWFPEIDDYRAAAKRVGESFHATFVPFQAMFEEAVKYAPPEHWAKDGVHPTATGAALMAHEWLRQVASNRS